MWEVLIKCWGFDVRDNTLYDSWVSWESMPCKLIGWETLEVENIICEAKY